MPKAGKQSQWVVEEEKTLLETRVGNISSARVTSARTGKNAQFYCLDFADWVNIIAVTRDRELVFIRQFRFGSRKDELEIPGGAVEEGEDPLSAGLRELLEETGYAGVNARIIGRVCPNPAIQKNICYTVLVEQVEKIADQSMDDMEDIEVLTFPVEEVERCIDSGEISHGLVLNALMFFWRGYAPQK